jgi:hypothetical protein
MNDWALITGASVGIGRELSLLCAEDGLNLILVARQQPALEELARKLEAEHHVQTLVLPKDISRDGAPQEIFDALHGTPVSVLINNAGFGLFGPFLKGNLQKQADMVQVNITALVRLTYLFAPLMVQRGSGRILNVASVAAFLPGPNSSVYFASKAFVHSFSLALAEELSGTGVTVTSLCPGGTATEFHARAGMHSHRHTLRMMDARTVAEQGYRAMMAGRRVVVAGLHNRMIVKLLNFVPATIAARVARNLNRQ